MRASLFTPILSLLLPIQAFAFGPPSFDSISERAYPVALTVVQHDSSIPTFAVSAESLSLSVNEKPMSDRPVYNFSKDYIAYCGSASIMNRACILGYIQKRYGQNIIDLQVMNDLNKEAEKLWSAQLQCNSHNFKAARENYRVGKFCSPEVKERFAELRIQIRSLAQTSLTIDTFGLFTLKSIHPLVIQMVLEENLSENYYANWRSDAETGGPVARNYLYVKETIALIHKESTYNQEDADYKHALEAQQVNPLYQTIRRVLFYNGFLDLLDSKDCSQWGLWPQATTVALKFHAHVGVADFSYWYDADRMHRIQEKSKMACGNNPMQGLPGGSLMAFARVFAEIPKKQN